MEAKKGLMEEFVDEEPYKWHFSLVYFLDDDYDAGLVSLMFVLSTVVSLTNLSWQRMTTSRTSCSKKLPSSPKCGTEESFMRSSLNTFFKPGLTVSGSKLTRLCAY